MALLSCHFFSSLAAEEPQAMWRSVPSSTPILFWLALFPLGPQLPLFKLTRHSSNNGAPCPPGASISAHPSHHLADVTSFPAVAHSPVSSGRFQSLFNTQHIISVHFLSACRRSPSLTPLRSLSRSLWCTQLQERCLTRSRGLMNMYVMLSEERERDTKNSWKPTHGRKHLVWVWKRCLLLLRMLEEGLKGQQVLRGRGDGGKSLQ